MFGFKNKLQREIAATSRNQYHLGGRTKEILIVCSA